MKKNFILFIIFFLCLNLVNAEPIVTLDMPDLVYVQVPFDISSSTSNLNGINYTNVMFKINLSYSVPFENGTERNEIFTITHYDGNSETYGVSETFELINGKFSGYWGPITGFPLIVGYDETSTFTIKMNESALLGIYDLSVELYDLSGNESLSIAEDSFNVLSYTTPTGGVVVNLDAESKILGFMTVFIIFLMVIFIYEKMFKPNVK